MLGAPIYVAGLRSPFQEKKRVTNIVLCGNLDQFSR
jgi:hypothetical protein